MRRQQLRVEGYAYDGEGADAGRNAFYDEAVTTPVYGIVYKLNPSISLYANRIEGLAQGATASGQVINAGEVFAPAETKQVEAGVKFDYQRFGANLAVYRIERPTDGFVQGNVFVQDGEQINKGVELSVFGEPIAGLRLMAGGTRMDTELKNTLMAAMTATTPSGCRPSSSTPASTGMCRGLRAGAECAHAAHWRAVCRPWQHAQPADLEPLRCRRALSL